MFVSIKQSLSSDWNLNRTPNIILDPMMRTLLVSSVLLLQGSQALFK